MTHRTFLGLDLGQAQDYTAIAVLKRPYVVPIVGQPVPKPPYAVPYLMRFPLGTPYPAIVARVVELLQTPELRGSMVVADQTGVGRAVVDMLTDAFRGRVTCQFCPVTITAGHGMSTDDRGHFRVPKKELVGVLQVLLQTRRLQIAQSLPDAVVLIKELEMFQVKITDAANETFGAWREGQHDDLVLAVGLAAWMGEKCLPQGPVELPQLWNNSPLY